MTLLLLCVLINGIITTIFKLFSRYGVNTLVAITTNYFVCVITACVVYGNPSLLLNIKTAPWLPYSIGLGFLLVTVFNIVGKTVQEHGVMIGTIFQKMSLIAPAIVAMIWFGDSVTTIKIAAIGIGIASIIMLSSGDKATEHKHLSLIFPVLTLIGSACVDLFLYLIEANKIAPGADITFLSSSFFFAGIFGLMLIIYQKIRESIVIDARSLIAGIILGIPNFFSIYLLLKVISNGLEGSVVFPVNNVGVLLISALIGILVFKENLTTSKKWGFVLAITCIVLLAIRI